ncbi:hypothetical protein VF14_08775 [Nostoc linckia z18]|uniref:Uncharacterized protein n=2 Tax=Nostoc linckia TaxID=92942 RepID=A0A9Q6EMG7_NOSLI|nr:hypothetical protein [Nostoc linckia]PHK42541.1 hypothetical protein VF12_02420 [Nostoc linckia z15]PHK44515.1 hypothetical protein VF13_21120 [Nostoc linckia z16]PHJ59561.1 hypothetical protein VF02_24400 [Nostoc linckia z1]PHJ65162.1 hypothetical protein VF05_21750 [Nostoc linckia z3]PHJ69564.1 hypothetical protein VF03_23480 [Nostoc linckia z2]
MSFQKIYAPASTTLFLCGVIAGIGSLSGYFNARQQYCDAITKPCTQVTVPADARLPQTAQDTTVLPGSGKMRLSLGLVALALLAGGYVLSGLEVDELKLKAKQEQIDEDLEEKRQQILAGEEEKKLVFASDIRYKDFEEELLDGYAQMLLEKNPELAAQILALEEKPQQSVIAASDSSSSPVVQVEPSDKTPPEELASGDTLLLQPVETNVLQELIDAGSRAIDALIETSQSLIFLGTPGAGKSVSMGVVIGRKKKRFGDKLWLFAIAMKNDHFAGAKVGRLNADSNDCYEIFLEVITELRQRAAMPKSEREEYCEANPVILILDDFMSQQKLLSSSLSKKIVRYPEESGAFQKISLGDAFNAGMAEIVFNGRELNVAGYVGTQSSNIDDLKFLSSKGGRTGVILMYQAFRNLKKNQGNYEIISQAIANHHVIADSRERERMRKVFDQAKALSVQEQRPMILSSNADAGQFILGIVPDMRGEYNEYERLFNGAEDEIEPFSWTIRKVGEFYPDTTAETLFNQIRDLANEGVSQREIIRQVLKCGENKNHPTRSYSVHGKTLFRWLINNFDNGELSAMFEEGNK